MFNRVIFMLVFIGPLLSEVSGELTKFSARRFGWVISYRRCWPNARTLAGLFSLPGLRWIDLAMYVFRLHSQRNRSLCSEFL